MACPSPAAGSQKEAAQRDPILNQFLNLLGVVQDGNCSRSFCTHSGWFWVCVCVRAFVYTCKPENQNELIFFNFDNRSEAFFLSFWQFWIP